MGQHQGRVVLESASPRGPSQHEQYADPLLKHDAAKDCQVGLASALAMAGLPAPSRPYLSARAEGGHAVIEWHLEEPPPGTPAADTLVLSLDSRDDDLPPATYHVNADDGSARLPPALATGDRYFVLGRAVSEQGIASEPASTPVEGTP